MLEECRIFAHLDMHMHIYIYTKGEAVRSVHVKSPESYMYTYLTNHKDLYK
jgi:hypothetical protein